MTTELIVDGECAGVIRATGEVTIKDFFVYCEGGVQVLSLDAKFDFGGIDPDSHVWVANLLLRQRMRLMGMAPEYYERQDRAARRYAERRAAYEALPWHRRLFARRPWSADEENYED